MPRPTIPIVPITPVPNVPRPTVVGGPTLPGLTVINLNRPGTITVPGGATIIGTVQQVGTPTDLPNIPGTTPPRAPSPRPATPKVPSPRPVSPVIPVQPTSPKTLPQSPQRTPIGGTITGGPHIPTTAPELVPLPKLVPINQQTQVSPVPTLPTPIPTTPKVPTIPVNIPTNTPTLGSPRTPTLGAVPVFRPATEPTSPGRKQATAITATNIEHVDNNVTKEECCVCTDPLVSPGKKTKCGHAICADCTKQLRKAECPVCRGKLEAGYLTQDANQAIEAAGREDARIQELKDVVYADYINMYPNREGVKFEAEARGYSDAFGYFMSNNPKITREEAIRIFRAYIQFMENERMKGNNLTPDAGINEFSVIGIQMLENRNLTFNEIYQLFFHEHH
jgi:hypothetical protein